MLTLCKIQINTIVNITDMKRLVLLFTAIILINGNLLGNTPLNSDDTSVEENMNMEIDGTIQLFSLLKEDVELIDTEAIPNANETVKNDFTLAYNRDYFIGFNDDKVEAITPMNFKRTAKKYFAEVPELAEMIGKPGFRYKNLPSIILFYNKKIANNKGLTKEDKLVVKEI